MKTCFLDPDDDSTHSSKRVEPHLKNNPRAGREARGRAKGCESNLSENGEALANSGTPSNDVNNESGDTFDSAATGVKTFWKMLETGPGFEVSKVVMAMSPVGVSEIMGCSSESDEPGKKEDASRRMKTEMGHCKREARVGRLQSTRSNETLPVRGDLPNPALEERVLVLMPG